MSKIKCPYCGEDVKLELERSLDRAKWLSSVEYADCPACYSWIEIQYEYKVEITELNRTELGDNANEIS